MLYGDDSFMYVEFVTKYLTFLESKGDREEYKVVYQKLYDNIFAKGLLDKINFGKYKLALTLMDKHSAFLNY